MASPGFQTPRALTLGQWGPEARHRREGSRVPVLGEPLVQPGRQTLTPSTHMTLHESEILPFPNPERNFVLPEEIIHEVREGKVVIEEEMKEEMKEDVDPHNGADDVFSSSGSLGKATEKSSKDKNPSDLGSKEGADKRKRSRVTDKVLTANSNPSSPSAAKRRRT
ncbi:MRG/MORF4L-binding protein isoform X2 [Eumetopias jubatus]|uniref:MRG/MORF4L-binding protein isoform X2 n=1 Tax=Eumetopias jubatus TaxID=34886 RepID=UPI0010163C0B|nr:MRG/MORF4L-binding protein isoform X2 [Eumetopias jubatus]